MMKFTFKIPLPDHNPKDAFEFLIGYGCIEKIDPLLGEVTYSLEGDSLGHLVQMVDEVGHEVNCYNWWDDKLDLFAQAQTQIDAQKVGTIEITEQQRKELERVLKFVAQGGPRAERQMATEVLETLKGFKPLRVEETV